MSDRDARGEAAGPGGAVVSVYEDGPLIVRGDFVITDQAGQPIPAGRRTVALCRCGRSAIKPFCDGSHTRTNFRAPGGAQGRRAAPGLEGDRDARPSAAGADGPGADPDSAPEGQAAAS